MEKSDTPALTLDEHNNLLLRLTLVQLTSINSRLDNLETQISELLARTATRPDTNNSVPALPSNENNAPTATASETPAASESTPPAPETATITRTIIRYICNGHEEGEESGDGPRIPPDISCLIDAKVHQMREDLLERVAQIMQESTMKTKGVVETSLNKMTDNITGIIDRNLTTMSEEIDNLKHLVEELQKKSRANPPPRDADLRNNMEKLRQNVTATNTMCNTEMEKVRDDQGKLREEIRVLKEEIYQLKVRQSVEALSIDN